MRVDFQVNSANPSRFGYFFQRTAKGEVHRRHQGSPREGGTGQQRLRISQVDMFAKARRKDYKMCEGVTLENEF